MEETTYRPREFRPEENRSFLVEVMERSGQPLNACYQCRRCAAGCPVGEAAGFLTPDRLIRLIALGDRDQALSNALVWKCVSCFTCGTRCPNDIQTARITETLKQMAKEEAIPPLSPKSAHFHDAFTGSGVRWGRVNEMEFMGVYEMKNILYEADRENYRAIMDELSTQMKLGQDMFRLKRLHAGWLFSLGRGELGALRKKGKQRLAKSGEPDQIRGSGSSGASGRRKGGPA